MSDSIKVAIKVRPLIKRELDENLPIQWTIQGNSIAPVDPELRKRGEGGFQFDHIFDPTQTNQDLFNTVAKPIIDAALNGVNGTIFAYGQTSSGKTYSMMGNEQSPGVIPMAVDYIFDTIDKTYGREFLLRISYIEIYNERVNDLLDKERTDLKIKEDPKTGQIKIPAKEEIINCPAKVLAVMKQGDRNRRTGETNMNERSSRSHTIFRITIESGASNNDSEGATVNVSQLNLVDLAGSERARQTGATGERFNEGRHINLSLSSLGLVIKQLSESQDNLHKYVNFRDSKLTRILQNSLGGNAMTTIICAITPAALEETQCTLAFASRAKHVKNKPCVNEDPSDAALLKRYAKQIAKLKAELKKVTSADVVEMESKLKEKEHANRILEERIELLKKSIVCASNPTDTESFNRCAKRRRTWGGSGTFASKTPPLQKAIGLPTINELDKTPEKVNKNDQFKRRQSIFQTLDMANQTFQTELADFEIELIENERKNNICFYDRNSVSDENVYVSRRPRNVQFQDDISVIDTSFRSVDTTPERRKSQQSTASEPASPGTPKIVLRNRVAFLMEEYNALRKEHRNLEEFTTLEKQLIVEDALEAAMAEYNKMFEASEKKCQEITEKYTRLESHSSASDKRLAELEQQLAESASELKALKRENQVLIDEANKSAAAMPRVNSQATNNEQETSSIFANATYFEELDVSDAPDTQCESMLINDSIQDNSLANVSAKKLDESKMSKERTNAAAYSEFISGIGEKSSAEVVTMMQELINVRLSLEDENSNLQSQLRRKVREADDVKNDIRELKSGIEKLQETIHLLTVENTDLTSKLSAEKLHAKEAEKNLQSTIAELNSSINALTEENRTMLENGAKELLAEQLKKAERRQSVASTDDEMREVIAKCQETIASLTAENEELSSNLMSKIEELDQVKDAKVAGEHECVYRELSINLSDRNKLLEVENIELSNNLMDKIEEYDRVKDDLEGFKSKLSKPATAAESSRLIEIFDGSHAEPAENAKNDKPRPTVDDLLRLSIGADNLLGRSIVEPRKNGLEKSISNGNGGEPTIDNLLEISLVAGGSPNESNESSDILTENVWKTRAELLQEQVNQLNSLNNKLSELKITSCTQCAHLAKLNENRKSLKLEAKTLNRKLQELQEKFDRECAASAPLRTKASEDLNLSVCDLTLNGSMMHDGNLNISFVEEKVQAMHQELEALRDKHDKLSDLYREKCDEIDKLQDAVCSRETTPTPTSAVESSSRTKRGDDKLEKIHTDMEKLRSDFRNFKKNIAGISAALQKFVNEKAIMQAEIESLRAEKAANSSGTADSTVAEEKIALLENQVTQLDREMSSSKLLAQQLESAKKSLEAEVESLKAERAAIEGKIEKSEDASTSEKMSFLENEVERLSAEIEISNSVKAELESVKRSLEAEVEFLKSNKSSEEKFAEAKKDTTMEEKAEFLENGVVHHEIQNSSLVTPELQNVESLLEPVESSSFGEEPAGLENVSMTQETMKYLEDEVSRLSEEINHSNVVKEELESTKCSLEAEVQSLKAEKVAFDEKITQTEGASAQERINLLENQVARLNDEIIHSNEVKEELESAKSSLEAEVQYLKVEKASTAAEHASTAQERITALETEVIRLSDEIDGGSRQAESVKSSLEAEIEALKAVCKAREESIRDLEKTMVNLESDNSTLLITLKKVASEKDQLLEKIAEAKAQVEGDSSNNNDQDFAKIVESLEIKLKETNSSLENYMEINQQLNDRLTTLKTSENELAASKSQLQDEIAALQAERTNYEESLAALRESLRQLEESNASTISRLSDTETSLKASEMENTELKDRLEASERSVEELADARLEITNLKAEVVDLRETNVSLMSELENERAKESEAKIEESYQTLKEYEKMVEELRTKVQDITNDLHANAKETTELNEQLTKLNTAKNELNDARLALESEVTSLKAERDDLEAALTGLRTSLDALEERNSCLNRELEVLKTEKEKVESVKNAISPEDHEEAINAMNARVKEMTAELTKYATENELLSGKVAELRKSLEEANVTENELANSTRLTNEKHTEELDAARVCITKEIKSLKPTAVNDELVKEKTISELFALFVRTIMSTEQEIIKALNERFERDIRKLEEQNRQSCDAEKRATVWAKELEAEIERTQQDLIGQEAKSTEFKSQIAKLENLLKESAHENQLLTEKMQVLELDFNSLQAELEKQQQQHPEAKENVTLNSPQERERLVEDEVQTREMELSAKLRLVEKQTKEKLQELTKSLEFYKTKNLELSSNLEGSEANERQLKSIADMKSNELIKCTITIERLQGELEHITENHNSLTLKHGETTRQVEEITSVLKTKCDMLSEYKTKLETITPEYEHLKDQAAERQVRLEKYKSEIECLTSANEREISSLKDLLDSSEIKSAGYQKQLAEMTNRNTQLQTEIAELRAKCEELERSNAKLMKSMRNSTSKVRAEEEMEDLRDKNRTLQRNLEGASNRIADLQEMKTQTLKELVDLRGKYEAICSENAEMRSALSSHKSSVEQTIELRGKYESLMQENNRLALELEGKKSELLHLENKHKDCATEIEKLKITNKDLDEEMDDMLNKIEELRTENADLDNKLYAIESSGALEETNRLRAQVEKLQTEIKSLETQRDQHRGELETATKMLESLRNENSELGARVGHLDRGDSLSCDSSRSASPALVEAVRVDNRRRRSRTELFNQKRQLGIFEPNDPPPCCGQCRCCSYRDEINKLERELVTKNGEIATMEIRIQSENFPHMKRCKDLEEVLASSRRKCKLMEAELQKIRDLKMAELSSECEKCKHWKANKRDQSTQCLPDSEQIYLSGMSSGVVEDHIKFTKLQKTNDRLKDLCRGRQRQIVELQNRITELENGFNTKSSIEDERSVTAGASMLSVNTKSDSAVNSRQAMKENVPIIWDNQRMPATHSRREWFH